MKIKKGKVILMCYDLFLAFGAIYDGMLMVLGNFSEYPPEWLEKVPFKGWFWPGVIAIVLYGIGNLIAAWLSLYKNNKGLFASLIMGIIFLISLLASIKILGEGYLATFQFIILSIIQILLTLFTLIISSKNTSKNNLVN